MLKDKVALVTGAARGIGKEITKQFIENGATVYAVDVLENELNETAKELGEMVIPLVFDVIDSIKRKEAFTRVWLEKKRLDILVNNAGVALSALIEMHREEDIDRCFAVDAVAVAKSIKNATRLMKKNKNGGSIVNISSIAGTHGNRGQLAYSGAKAAVIGITKAASKELAEFQIRVNAIAPGIIETPMLRSSLTTKIIEDYANQNVGMHRIGTVHDIANAVMFFVDDKSSYITGQILNVDGGFIL
jgi:3-oxoacyl-[acyl-carrier protein] reductase